MTSTIIPFITVLFSLSCHSRLPSRNDISAVNAFQSIRSSAFAALGQHQSGSSGRSNDDNENNSPFPRGDGPPYLAVITEKNACNSDANLEKTLSTLKDATSTHLVDLISIRLEREAPNGHNQDDTGAQVQRVITLTRELIGWSKERKSPFKVVLSSDWMDVAIKSGAHGVHFKESQSPSIEDIRQQYKERDLPPPLVGTSAHSVGSVKRAWEAYRPHYFFVGTCYPTLSHPGKVEMEGPALPGQVVGVLDDVLAGTYASRPVVFAIGGINTETCRDPVVKYGADGVAVIRSVMQSADPAASVRLIQKRMQVA